MTSSNTWPQRIAVARRAVDAAKLAEEQAIRDALADSTPVSDVARALGTKDRTRIYAIQGKDPQGQAPQQPALTPAVYLRGAGADAATWQRVEAAMWARGWATVRDRTTAFHLARGGTPVVFCDFSTDLDATPGAHFGYKLFVRVGRVRAKYGTDRRHVQLAELLPADVVAGLIREGAAWVHRSVDVEGNDMELPLVNGGDNPRPYRRDGLDEQILARLVADALDQ
ncbi:hypothetical protein [Catellatospora sp. NPDC049133]|uniref:hypothetical protein n=1 Tax=Catellatospora sp. NPDC049133 TaxID=3155499 RepID=UPI0034005F3F